jgi:prepilin-type processing-associated H-X9-DG protein
VKGINNKEGRVGSFHPNGINAVFFDGAVRFLPNSCPKEILKALGTCSGGESVTLDQLR